MDHFKKLINTGNLQEIVSLMFERNNGIPTLRDGFYHERSLWDFKSEVPGSGKAHEEAWAEIARHTLAFHNAEGGLLIFGINDRSFGFTKAYNYCDSARFNNGIRRYIGDLFYVTFSREFIQPDQGYLGIALIPPRGPRVVRFAADAPSKHNRPFSRGDIAVRESDSSRVYRGDEANKYVSNLASPSFGRGFFIDDSNYRILSPEYKSFVYRPKLCNAVLEGLHHPRAAVTSLLGIGGVGKTAIATWAAIEAYRNNTFSFIVSITAKDRELTAKSIVPLEKQLTSYEELLDTIFRVLRLDEPLHYEPNAKEAFLKEILADSNGLLYIDNMETVDDPRIIGFLDDLPLGVRALVTSRMPQIRVSNYPVEVGPLKDFEISEFVEAMLAEDQYAYLSDLSSAERLAFGSACNGLPLAMRWIGARCANPKEALQRAKDINDQSQTNEQLLEFSFRRIFQGLSEDERLLLKALSLYDRPLAREAIHIVSDVEYRRTSDLLGGLRDSSLVENRFDEELNDNVFTLLPITRAFVYGEVRQERGLEDKLRARMRDWLEARDVSDPVRRTLVRASRQSQDSSEEVLLQLAEQELRQGGNLVEVEKLYEEALKRNPKNWITHRKYAEFLRHWVQETSRAISEYRLACQYIQPKDKENAAATFREFGILLKQSGNPSGLKESTEALQKAVELNPKDPVAIHALGDNYMRMGQYTPSIKLLDPLRKHSNPKTRAFALKTLIQCYEAQRDIVAAAHLRRELEDVKD